MQFSRWAPLDLVDVYCAALTNHTTWQLLPLRFEVWQMRFFERSGKKLRHLNLSHI